MSITSTELADLGAALRKALGAENRVERPSPDPEWRTPWASLARDLDVASFCVSEEHEGFGDEVQAALVTARELGAVLHGAHYPAVVTAGYALSRWLDGDRSVVGEIRDGTHWPALAFLGAGAAVAEGPGGVRLDGTAHLVGGAPEADSFLLLPPDGDTMLFVRRGDTCELSREHRFDVTRSCADIVFSKAEAKAVEQEPGGRSRVESLYGLLLAGDSLGGLERMIERTLAHCRGRTAFGKPLAGFQAVQHRLVDHSVRLRGMTLLAEEAAAGLAADAPDARRRVLLTEASVAAGAVPMLHDLLQLTGAIGFTWEYGLHLYERRAHLNARLGRNPRRALRAIAGHEGWTPHGG